MTSQLICQDLVATVCYQYNLLSYDKSLCRRMRLKLGERAFSVAATRIWNQLLIEIKVATYTPAFKRKLFSEVYLQ